MKWKIAINSQCNCCGQDEDYLHYFMSCPYLKEFWVKIQQILKKSNIENFVTLKHIVFGYKIFDKDYFDFNYFLTILGFSIQKAYYVSEQKTKQVNIYSLFMREYITRISQVQKLQNSKLLAKIKKILKCKYVCIVYMYMYVCICMDVCVQMQMRIYRYI